MSYSLVQGGAAAVHGAAAAHMEKNWGRSFPGAWYWAQGVQLEGSQGGGGGAAPAARAAFALAGGKPPAPLVPQRLVPPMWLLGVRTASRRQAEAAGACLWARCSCATLAGRKPPAAG
jgi:hypothetical protein